MFDRGVLGIIIALAASGITKHYCAPAAEHDPMKYFSQIFAPTNNRRLNELIGFVLCISGLLLFLALASYSPLDPSFNSASVLTGSQSARNWVGLVGAIVSDLMLQGFGNRSISGSGVSGGAGLALVPLAQDHVPGCEVSGSGLAAGVCPGAAGAYARARALDGRDSHGRPGRTHRRRRPHPLLESGRRIYCVRHDFGSALYLTTAFSFASLQVWAPTRFAFVVALWNRYKDWQDNRAKKKMQKELEKRRATRPTITAQLIPARPAAAPAPVVCA